MPIPLHTPQDSATVGLPSVHAAVCVRVCVCTCTDQWSILPKRDSLRWPVVEFITIRGDDEYKARVSWVEVEEQNAHGGKKVPWLDRLH